MVPVKPSSVLSTPYRSHQAHARVQPSASTMVPIPIAFFPVHPGCHGSPSNPTPSLNGALLR
ncbi:hypothetical protein BDV09DRAFT_159327, partial [Aspergillus tetrazonus]